MNRRDDLRRHGAIAAAALPTAAVIWFIFHGVYENLSASEQAVGYVEPTTQSGIYFGYFVMLAAIVILTAIGLWSAVKCLFLLVRGP
jgi:hypothetical protein